MKSTYNRAMPQDTRQSFSEFSIFLQTRFAPVVTLLYLLLAMMVFLVTPILYFVAIRTPFIGAYVEHTLMINDARPTTPGAWGEDLRLPTFGYQIMAVNGNEVSSVIELRQTLNRLKVGEQIELLLRDPDGGRKAIKTTLIYLPAGDRLGYFFLPYLIGLVYLLSGLYVFSIRRYDPAGRAFVLFTASTGIALACLFDLYTTSYLASVWSFALAMVGGALVNLALLFPERVRWVVKNPFYGWIGYGVALILGIYSWTTIYNFTIPRAYVLAWQLEFIFVAFSAVFFMFMVGRCWLVAPSSIMRGQARLIFWGALLSFGPIALWFVITIINPAIQFTPWLLLPLVFFPLFTGYAIIRYRLLRTDYILSRAVLYAILAILTISSYIFLVGGLSLVFGNVISAGNPLVIGIFIFLLAIIFNPLRDYLQKAVDRYFFRGQIVYREMQQAFGRELTQVMELAEIVALLRRFIDQSLSPSFLHIYLYDPLSGHYIATANEKGILTSDIRFPSNSVLVHVLSRQRGALYLADVVSLPAALLPEMARLSLLSASLFIPLPGRSQLIGWIALGNRRSAEPYTDRDLSYLDALSDQAALAVERAQVVADLERRVREMNVLTRVAQGVSFTVAFDDILELISAQTNQIVPARDFRVTLVDKETEIVYHAFYLENDERIHERENQPLSVSQGLEIEVINSQRALLTDDYERECRGRGLLPAAHGVYAWMGVPLNAGAETIGVMSIASRDPAVIYTDEQRDLLQAIADQASGAIVKARSLEESERRARQLAKLNEIGLGLTSTLDIKPLLNQILESATDILNCQAGSLFLVDSQTDELIFEVVLGPVAANLVGRRLPPGTGLVGQSVQAARPLIANDAKRRKEWFDKTDEQTGFDTQDLLVVPMRVQDRVIGVIEVINKANGAPFTDADQELLTAFTSQATIAIENARLYTMTDQALAERVEELSVMQRIDRELNASLDIERAMRITLDWALRQSRAEAGLVGAVEEEGVRVMVAQGYPSDILVSRDDGNGNHSQLVVNLPTLRDSVQRGQARCVLASEVENRAAFSLLKGAQSQIVIPIRRETNTIGVLLLESYHPEASPEEMLNFLTRLSDHAAIAIANARLYEEVIEANLAKSRFVSFVAHELKNPMASIKGYTELVATGMAGSVNEMQSSFLATVRSNVDRMNTIVSDLNDLTKIQVGNLRLDFKAVKISDVLDDVVRSLRRQVEEKEQHMEMHLPEDLPLVWADAARMAQILTNLVSNAHKYTPQAGVFDIGAERQVMQDGSLAGTEFVHIWVKDQGIGISEEDQKKIFQQYFRTDDAKEMASGTGLGLAITKSLVELQGGRIWFDSVFEQGTTFHFTLPVAETQ
jgi:signal transduction histidine kinase